MLVLTKTPKIPVKILAVKCGHRLNGNLVPSLFLAGSSREHVVCSSEVYVSLGG